MSSYLTDDYGNLGRDAQELLDRFVEMQVTSIPSYTPREDIYYFEEEEELDQVPEYDSGEQEQCTSVCIQTGDGSLSCVRVCLQEREILDMSLVPPPVIVLPQEVLSLNPYVSLNGHKYSITDLVSQLYSTQDTIVISGTDETISKLQASNVLTLLSKGYSNIVASINSEAAYAVKPEFRVSTEEDIVVFDTLSRRFLESQRENDPDYYVDAFEKYAVEIAMRLGMDYKSAINFGIARHINESNPFQGPRPMGIDVDIISAILRYESEDLVREPCNLSEMSQRLQNVFNIPLTEADMFAASWAYDIPFVVTLDELYTIAEGDPVKIEAIRNSNRSGIPLAACMSDREFRRRLHSVDPDLLSSIAEEIPIIDPFVDKVGRDTEYVIYENSLLVGSPLAPPLFHSVGSDALKDYSEKPTSIRFVKDCVEMKR